MNLDALRPHFRGDLLTPGCSGYDQARRIWNGMIDRRPAAIARCTGTADVVAAVRFAGEADIYPSIRAGGHNVAGIAIAEDGFVIDVTPMKGIHVDHTDRVAIAQTGLTWGEFDRETQVFGLATTGGVISTTGIGGLTLGGGVGWLMGKCGLVCDNTLSYTLVAPTGHVITANKEEHPDLFWALKGGGGNFGVVTSISYHLYPITHVLSGMLLYPLSSGREVLRHYRDFVMAGLPDELIMYASSVTTPEGLKAIAIIPAYCGEDLAEGEKLIHQFSHAAPPLADLTARMPYVAMQQMLDAAAPYGVRSYWKSTYLADLPDEAIDTFVTLAEECPSPRSIIVLEHSHGAAARVSPDATAFGMRSQPFDMVIMSLWDDPAQDEINRDWARKVYTGMLPWSAGVVYVNGMAEDDAPRIREAYSRSYDRLVNVKTKYDPSNRFRHNHNIHPRN